MWEGVKDPFALVQECSQVALQVFAFVGFMMVLHRVGATNPSCHSPSHANGVEKTAFGAGVWSHSHPETGTPISQQWAEVVDRTETLSEGHIEFRGE